MYILRNKMITNPAVKIMFPFCGIIYSHIFIAKKKKWGKSLVEKELDNECYNF